LQPTDWNAYYHRPAAPAKLTRKISSAKILATLAPALAHQEISVCELGGANSCFADDFLKRQNIVNYHIIDTNDYGVELFKTRYATEHRATAEILDARGLDTNPSFDIVYSVGLIEHFLEDDTANCIESHFRVCKPGGVVLITFPTPTLIYRVIRKIAEALDLWEFHDERPLQFSEVESTAKPLGLSLHRSTNWWIGLTQGYVMYRKPTSSAI